LRSWQDGVENPAGGGVSRKISSDWVNGVALQTSDERSLSTEDVSSSESDWVIGGDTGECKSGGSDIIRNNKMKK
jgi:hypothetical protein